MKALVVSALLEAIGRLIGVIEKRVNSSQRPVTKTFKHDGVSDAELDRLLARAKDLPKT